MSFVKKTKPLVPKDFEEDDGGCEDEYPCIDVYDQTQLIERLKRSGELEVPSE